MEILKWMRTSIVGKIISIVLVVLAVFFPLVTFLVIDCNARNGLTMKPSGDGNYYIVTDCPENKSEVIIPNKYGGKLVKTIKDEAFYDCDDLTSVIISDSVTTIGEWAFYSCNSLTSVTIGNNVATIAEKAFYCCSALKCIVIPDSVTSIGEWAFRYSSIKSVGLGSGITSIGKRVFSYTCLVSVTIPDNITFIGQEAFEHCNYMTDLTISDSVIYIGDGAFRDCTNLRCITFNGTVEKWNAISKVSNWNLDVPATEVVCTDGTVKLK